MKRYLYHSLTVRAEDFEALALANGRSRSSLSTPCNGRLPFVFRLTRRVAHRNVEIFIGQLIPFTALIKLSFFNDQDSRFYHIILTINLFDFTKES